jgi:hypothetical protein
MLFGRFDAAEAAGVELNATTIKPQNKNRFIRIAAPPSPRTREPLFPAWCRLNSRHDVLKPSASTRLLPARDRPDDPICALKTALEQPDQQHNDYDQRYEPASDVHATPACAVAATC